MSADYGTRALSLVDILRARRLAENGTILNTQIRCTTAANGLDTALLKSMMPHTSRHTLMARYEGQRVVGQFYIAQNNPVARIVYLAPDMTPGTDDSAWLLLLDAMVTEAGKRGAHVLTGEVDEQSELFLTMRQSGFAVYARQSLWARRAGAPHPPPIDADIRQATENDGSRVYALYRRTVPRLMQQVETPPDVNGYVYCVKDQVMGFVHVATGRSGVLLTPYIDPDAPPQAGQILAAVAAKFPPDGKQRLIVRVPRHQNWLSDTLADNQFERLLQQAVMVRHIAAGIHSPDFSRLEEKLAGSAAKRQTGELPEI